MKIRPVLLSGGTGTRLWPVSRQRQPKQFVPLMGAECLFAARLRAVADRTLFAPPLIVGNAEHKFLILENLERLGITDATILLEPVGRNTAAAAIVAALHDKDAAELLHLVMPSDHVIEDQAAFLQAIQRAASSATDGALVLFGITPTYPETGYGYILPDAPTHHAGVFGLRAFKEKPDEAGARALIGQGALWNSGLFLYAPSVLLAETEKAAPAYLAPCRAALDAARTDLGCRMLDKAAYKTVPNEPFDRVIMERTMCGAVVPCSMGWSDVGSWETLWHIGAKDAAGNVLSGPVVAQDVKNAYIRSNGVTVAAMGLEDIAIVATKDAILVAPRGKAQEIRALVGAVEAESPSLAQEHPRVLRPWGSYEGIASGPNFQVKHIVVRPGGVLSLQMHHHRAEHWVVVAGTAKVECGATEKIIFPNQSIFIPQGEKHRLSNPGTVDLQLIEVQSGDYIGEDDIVRFEDKYGRAK